jgi:flagellar M-ring protein FliF
MDFLNTALAQIKDLFGSMTMGARITAALLLAVVVVSLGYLFTHHGYGNNAYLMNGEMFPAGQLPLMEAAFAKAGLSGYQVDGTRVRIPSGQEAAYVAALAENDALPPRFGEALDKALSTSNIFMDHQQREQLVRTAKQKQLSLFIRKFQGVEDAWVEVAVETRPGFRKEQVKSAAVTVVTAGSRPLDAHQVNSIRKLVGGSFAMKPEEVVVGDSSGLAISGSVDAAFPGDPSEHPDIARQRTFEQDLEQKIRTALGYVTGLQVAVSAKLSAERIHREEQVKYDPKTVPIQSTETTNTRTMEGAAPQGPPGFQAQQNQRMALAAAPTRGNTEQEEQSEQQSVNAVPGTRTETEKAGLTLERASATVSVPSSHIERVWRQQNPAPSGGQAPEPDPKALAALEAQETAKIKTVVAGILPPVEGVADLTNLVTVGVFQDIPPDPIPAPAMSQQALSWLGQSWSLIGVLGLAAFSLLMLRSMVRATPVAAEPVPAAPNLPASAAAEPPAAVEPAEKAAAKKRFQADEHSLRDELSELVAEDPDTAANILRNWIGSST